MIEFYTHQKNSPRGRQAAWGQKTKGKFMLPRNWSEGNPESSTLAFALRYIDAGLSVIPVLDDGSKKPAIVTWKPFQCIIARAEHCRRWLTGKTHGIAIVAGAGSGGLEVMDFDDPKAFDAWYFLVEDIDKDLLDTLPMVITPHGRHVYFRCDSPEGNQKLSRNETGETLIETRGRGGYVLAPGCPPECHSSGELYREMDGPSITETPKITMEQREFLFAAARSMSKYVRNEASVNGTGGSDEKNRPGDRFNRSADWDSILTPAGWSMLLERGEVSYWRRPGKDERGWSATLGYCKDSEGIPLLHVFSTNAKPFEADTSYTPFVAIALLKHNGDFKAAARALAQGSEPLSAEELSSGTSDLPDADPIFATDTGNAKRLVQQYGEDIRFCHQWKTWQIWNGSRWEVDQSGHMVRLAKAVTVALSTETPTNLNQYVANLKWCIRSQAAGRINAMIDLAQSEWGIPILPRDLDTNPWLLNCINGVLNLEDGELYQHDRNDYITKMAPVAYDAGAECPIWKATVYQAFGESEPLVSGFQRLLGYCLTGHVSEQILPILHGSGANGKSTIINTFLAMLGPDYAVKASRDLLMEVKNDKHSTGTAWLHGKRLVVAMETAADARLDEALIKELTGGDPITARRMHENYSTFLPTHKLAMVTNHKPRVRGTDYAMWRRVRLFPFNVTIPDDMQDKSLPEKLKAELSGILTWCVRGCREWQEHGLGDPLEVQEATAEYRESEDVISQFIAEKCTTTDPTARIRAATLYRVFTEWCESSGERVWSQRMFGPAIREHGFAAFTSNGTWYRGLDLRRQGT